MLNKLVAAIKNIEICSILMPPHFVQICNRLGQLGAIDNSAGDFWKRKQH